MRNYRSLPRLYPAFSLVELLIVLAIIAILTAIALGVFGHVREKGRQAVCLSNERQLGVALLQYAQDFDDNLPSGTQGSAVTSEGKPLPGGNGVGWAGQVFSYAKEVGVFACPSEGDFTGPGLRRDPNDPNILSSKGVTVSYGYNSVLPSQYTSSHVGGMLASIVAPSHMVMLFEVSGDIANIRVPDENEPAGVKVHSAAGSGSSSPSVNKSGFGNKYGVRYATGDFAGHSPEPKAEYTGVQGRHSGGANYLLVDGHVKWLRPEKVFPAGLAIDRTSQGYQAAFINQQK